MTQGICLIYTLEAWFSMSLHSNMCNLYSYRPKLFFNWGPFVPVGRAAASLLSSFLDHVKDPCSSHMASNITVNPCSSPEKDAADSGALTSEPGDKTSHSGKLVLYVYGRVIYHNCC